MRRGFGKIHTKKRHSGQNTMENENRIRQNTYKKKEFGEKIKIKSIVGKIEWSMRSGFGKIHTKKKHSGQNTMENA
jgi:hypothetical protein